MFALLGVSVATISVNIAANVVSPANDFANLAPKHITFKMGGVLTGVLGIVIVVLLVVWFFGGFAGMHPPPAL